MPRIDPQQLLVCLTPLLAQNGGIKSPGEVIRLANLMEKYSKKLVSKCIYIQILKSTETDLLGQFMAAGGWNLVHNWLRDGSESDNWPFVQELLEMLLLCPVDGNRLKSNHTPKIVKTLSLACADQTVQILSKKLVEQWLKIAHQEKQHQNGTNGIVTRAGVVKNSIDESLNNKVDVAANGQVTEEKQSKENVKYKVSNKEGSGKLLLSLKRSTSPSIDEKESKVQRSDSMEPKSKSSSSTSDKDKDKSKKTSSSSSSSHKSSSKSSHRGRSSSSSSSHHKSSSSSKDKHRESSKSSSSKSSSSSTREKDKDKDKSKDSERRKKDPEKTQAEKDKETLNFLAPMSSSKLQRIPKRQHSENSENKSSESNKESGETTPTKVVKSSEPVEKKKPSISIEVRKGDKPKTVKTLNSQFRNHGLGEEPPKPPSRKDLKKPAAAPSIILLPTLPSATPVVKAATSPTPSKKIQLEKAPESEVPERVGGVKLIKAKPMLIESIGFMDALSASTASKKDPKKRKRLTSNSKKDEPETPKVESKPLKFYQDTLEEAMEIATGEKSPTKEADTSADEKEIKAGIKSPDATETIEKRTEDKEKSPESDEPEEKRPPGIGCGPDGPPRVLVSPNTTRRKKRSIKWRADEDLTEVRFFELDETERTNVTKTSFTEQKQMEHVGERNAFEQGRKMQTDDSMAEQTTWRALIVVDNVPEINIGYKSREAEIQAEREKNVLQELYFRHSLNDSPHEPDPEAYEHVEPQIVPLEDVTGNPDSVNNHTDIQWPAPKGELPATFLSNAFGNVFSNLNIPPALGIPPNIALNSSIANPLASFALGGMPSQMPPNPILNQWSIPPAAFLQPPPMMMPSQVPGLPPHRAGGINNNYRSNNSRPHVNSSNNNPGNWVRGNTRRGVCNKFQRSGFCPNKNCPYVHER